MAKKSLYDKADKKLQRLATTIGAIVAVVGALTGALGWVQTQFTNAVSSQMNDLKNEMQESDKRTEIQITRLELMTLIDTQPENIAEIEKVAKHYFRDLGANWYMTSIYSKWCQKYGGDPTIIIGEK